MSEIIIKCPECKATFPLSQAVSKDITNNLEKELKVKLEKELKEKNNEELKYLKAQLDSQDKILETFRYNEVALRKQKRDLEEREKNLQLQVERTLDEERVKITEKASKEAEEYHRYKDLEKDKKLSDMLSQVEELKRRIEQGSQKIQGEVFEADLEKNLKSTFTYDTIEPVSSGVKGGDIIQTVNTRSGRECGKILWELKRTKSFSESWIPKLKSDARNSKVDICLLVSESLPESVNDFTEIDGVWICSMELCIPLASVLRQTLALVSQERSLQEGKKSKSELVYDYLIGVEFKGRIEAIVESFKGMKEDLDSERRAMEKIWNKREKQLGTVLLNIAGMHGDLTGYMGNNLPEIKNLQLT